MPSDDGTMAIIKAVRNVLAADASFVGIGIYHAEVPRSASNPHIVLSLPTNHRESCLGRGMSYRMLRISVKAVATEAAGISGFKASRTLADRALHLLTNVVTTTPETKLNAHLTDWVAMTPMEDGAVGPFTDSIPGEVDDTRSVRWHCGNYIRFGLSPV